MRKVSPPKHKLTLMFFTPHPDDIELGTPFVFMESLRLGYRVIEVVMTGGEFGTEHDEFKGARLRKIRVKELDNANKEFERGTNNSVEVIRLGYVDGYLPVNQQAIQRVTALIRKEKPRFIFVPDPVFPQDYHTDHINTGKLVLYSLFKLNKLVIPRVFYYYSTRSKFYIKCQWNDLKTVNAALDAHKSQYTPLAVRLIIGLYNKVSLFRHLIERGSISESFREQKFKNGRPISPKKFTFFERIIYYMFSTVTIWGYMRLHNLTPEEVGLDRNKIYLSNVP